MALNQHLLPPSDKTTRLLASHNQRILWEWISWSTSSDFSRIWFSFKMNPLDWTYESNKQRHYSGLFLGHFWVNILTHQYLRVTILSSNVVTSGWQMRTDYFQTSLFLALIMTDKPRQNLTDFVNLQICGWSPDFRDGGEIAENLHFLISQLSAAVHRALCRIFASGSGHPAMVSWEWLKRNPRFCGEKSCVGLGSSRGHVMRGIPPHWPPKIQLPITPRKCKTQDT